MRRDCRRCDEQFKPVHGNNFYCPSCRKIIGKANGFAKLDSEQRAILRRYAGKIYIHELAEKLGISKPTLLRYVRLNPDSPVKNLNSHRYKDDVIKKVCTYYYKHGMVKTKAKFEKPGSKIKVRSVIERYAKALVEPRQVRWTDKEIVLAHKMTPILTDKSLAKYFDRPNAKEGSIVSFKIKKMNIRGRIILGLARWQIKGLVSDQLQYIVKNVSGQNPQYTALWIDIEQHLLPTVDENLKIAIKAMAKFQRMMYGSDVRKYIRQTINKYELDRSVQWLQI